MAEYTVFDNSTKREVTFEWNDPNPPTDADMEEVFAAAAQQTPATLSKKIFGEQGGSTMGIASEAGKRSAASGKRFLQDTAVDAVKGVVGLGESVVGAADLVTGNLAGEGLAAVGYDPKKTDEILSSGYSAERQQANANVQGAKGFMETLGALVDNPSVAFGSIVESAPLSLGSAAAARTLAVRLLARAGIAPGTAAATEFFANPATQAKLLAAAAGTEGVMTAGSIQEGGRQGGRDYTDTVLPALAAGAVTGTISAVTSKIPGFKDAEVSAATAGMAGEAAGGFLQAGKEIAKSMFKEGVLEELPQSAQEQVFTNLAMGKPWDEGVGEAAAQGMVAGMGQGGGMTAVSETMNRKDAIRSRLDKMRGKTSVVVPDTGIRDPTVSVDDAIAAAAAEVSGEWDRGNRDELLKSLGGEVDPVAEAISGARGSLDVADPAQALADPMLREIEGAQLTADPFKDYPLARQIIQPGAPTAAGGEIIGVEGYRQKDVIPNQPILNDEQEAVQDTFLKGGPALNRDAIDEVLANQNDPNLADEIAKGRQEAEALRQAGQLPAAEQTNPNGAGPSPVTKVDAPAQPLPAPGAFSRDGSPAVQILDGAKLESGMVVSGNYSPDRNKPNPFTGKVVNIRENEVDRGIKTATVELDTPVDVWGTGKPYKTIEVNMDKNGTVVDTKYRQTPALASAPKAEATPAAKIETPLSAVQQEFIRGKVKALGSLEAVRAKYPGDRTPVDRFATQYAEQLFKPFEQQADVQAGTLAKTLEQAGITPDNPAHAAILDERRKRERAPDPQTGFISKEHFEPTMERAWNEHGNGRDFSYAEIDLRNLGGMNAKLGTSGADTHIKAISKIISEEVAAEIPQAQIFRKGGDEFGVVAPGASAETVNNILAKAADRVKMYAQENGLDQIPHAKGKPTPGIGIEYGTADFKDHGSLVDVRRTADIAVEEAKNVNVSKTEEVRAVAPGGQAGRVEPGAAGAQSVRQEAAGAGARQAAAARVTAESLKVNRQKDDIAVAISKLGGLDIVEAQREWGNVVRDSRKALANHVLKQTRRFGAVFKNGGKPLDKMRESLVGQGYLPEGADLQDLYELIEAATRGDMAVSAENAQESELEREAREFEERAIAGMTEEEKRAHDDIMDLLDADETVSPADTSFDFGYNVEGYEFEGIDEEGNQGAAGETQPGIEGEGDRAGEADDESATAERTDDAGGWRQGVAVQGDRAVPTIGGVQRQGGKRASTSDLMDGFTPEPPGLFKEEELRYNDSRANKTHSISSVSPIGEGADRSGRADGVREQLAFFTPSGEPTPEARQVVEVARQVKTFTKTARVITGHIRSGLTSIDSPQDLAHVMAGLRKKTVENFVIVVTAADGRIIGVIDQTTGTVNQSLVHPSLVLGASSLLDGAENVYLVHNHPTGDPTFSTEDRAITNRIYEAGRDTGLTVKGIMAIGSRTATFFDPEYQDTTGPFPIPAMPRNQQLPVEGARAFTRRPAADAPRLTSPDQIPEILASAGIEGEGVALLDGKNRVVGFVPMSSNDMFLLRTGNKDTGAGLLTKTIREANAVAMVAVSTRRAPAQNLGSYGDALGVKLLDIYNPEDGASAASMGLATANGATWFSRGSEPATGVDAARVQATLTGFTSDMKNAPPWEAVQSETDLPEAVQYEINSLNASGAVRGAFASGKIFIVADNLNSADDAEPVFLHEAVAHYGLRGLLGSRFKPVLQQIAMVYGKKGLQPIADRYNLDLSKNEDRMTAAEEKLAEMAETADRVGIVKRAIAAVRDWLRQHGFKVDWSDSDIKALLARARGYVERSNSQATTLFDGDRFMFVRAQDGEAGAFSDLTDRQARVEIDDSGAKIKNRGDWLSILTNREGESARLSAVLDHPLLYERFPEAANIIVKLSDPHASKRLGASYNPDTETIIIGRDERDFKEIALHEIQHAIQEKEGFAKGGNLGEIAKRPMNYLSAAQLAEAKSLPGYRTASNPFNFLDDYAKKVLPSPMNIYQRHSGEEESRRVSARADMTEADRRGKPYDRTDIADPSSLITRMSGGEVQSVNSPWLNSRGNAKASPDVSEREALAAQERRDIASAAIKDLGNLIKGPAFFDVFDYFLKNKGRAVGVDRQPSELVGGDASPQEGAGQNASADAKFFSDLFNRKSFKEQGFSGLDVETQGVVLEHVFRSGQDGEVANLIVNLLPVAMVDQLAREQLTPEMLFHDPSMIKSWLVSRSSSGIPVRGNGPDAAVRVVALIRAIESAGFAHTDLVGSAVDGGAAGIASEIRHFMDSFNGMAQSIRLSPTSQGDLSPSRFSLAGANSSDIPAETKTEKAWRKLQDKYNRVSRLQTWLDGQGVRLSDLANASRGLYTYQGKIADQLDRFMTNEIQPLVQAAAKAKVSLDDISDYLLMQHAEEANEQMRKLHDDPAALAFGVTDAEAQQALADYQARPDFATLKDLADQFQAFSGQTADMLEDNGIISPEMRAAWDGAYKKYVPLRGGEEDTKTGAGKGLRVNGKQQRRSGHGRRDEHVIENIIKARERAIKTVEKNNVALSIAQLIHEAADDRIGTIGKPEKRRVFKSVKQYTVLFQGAPVAAFTSEADADRFVERDRKANGKPISDYVLNVSTDPTVNWMTSPMLGENEINAYINGHQVRIQINDEVAAGALTNLGAEGLGTILSVGKQINNYFSRAYTGYDPRFTIRNTFRDFTAGMVNLTGDYGAATAAKIAANYPKAIREFIKARKDPALSTWVDRYRKQGGSTGASWLSSLERLGEDVEAIYQEQIGSVATYRNVFAAEKAKGRSNMAARAKALGRSGVAGFHKVPVMGHFLKLINAMNAVSENAFRVSTFMTLVQEGKSEAEAGEAAKNSTINFDKRGELGAQMGALWLFFNPAMQGIQRSFFALTQSEHKLQAQALVGSMALAGFMAAELARGMGGDDDDEWDKIPRSVKNRNFVIRTGEKTQITIPLPYEYGSFVGIGYAMNDAVHGKFDKRAGLNLASAIMDGLAPLGNPVSDEGDIQPLAMMPTVAKLVLAPKTNTNSFGSRIAPEKYQESKPDSQNMWRGTKGSVYDRVATGMNEATGGSEYSAGMVDVSPEILKYYTRTLLGGAFTFVDQVVGLGIVGANGAQPDLAEIPMGSVLVRENTVRDTRRMFWDIAKDAKTAIDGFNAAKKNRDVEAARDIRQDKADLLAVAGLAARQAKLAKAKRDAVDAIRLDDSLSFSAKRAMTKELEAQESKIYDRLIKQFNQ